MRLVPKAPVVHRESVGCADRAKKMIIGQGPNLLCATPPYALLISKSLYVVDLTLSIKSLINQQIQLCRKCDATCRTTT